MMSVQESVTTELADDSTLWDLTDRAVHEAPKWSTEIDLRAMRLCMSLNCATDMVFYDIRATLNQSRTVSPSALQLLLVLSVFGEMELRSLTRLSNMSRAASSALADSMHRQNLITRRPSTEDRRVVIISITEEGKKLFLESFLEYNRREQLWAEALTEKEQDQLNGLLGKLVSAGLRRPGLLTRS